MGANLPRQKAWGVGSGAWRYSSTLRYCTAAYHSPLPTILEDFHREIAPRPFLQVFQQLRQRAQRLSQVLVQHRVGRDLAERPLPSIHLVEQPLEGAGRVAQAIGELGEVHAQ